jgi:antirestriction protein ArdC
MMAKKSKDEIYEEVTSQVIESLKLGEIPWESPWIGIGYHRNYVSKKPYRGVNPMLLGISASVNGFESLNWMTYKQAAELSVKQWLKSEGLQDTDENRKLYKATDGAYKGVREGEKSTMITFWKPLVIDDSDNLDSSGKPIKKTIPLLKYIYVFNGDQTDLELEEPDNNKDMLDFTPIEAAAEIIDNWEDKPRIIELGDVACYIPSQDEINMPQRKQFLSEEYFYKTLYHECIHATGHKSRLNRVKNWSSFGSEPYAQEELVAEIGASMLVSYAGIKTEDTDRNTAAYIKNWIKRLEEDPKLIIGASGKAQKAVDYIIGTSYEQEVEKYDNEKEEVNV